MVANVDLVVVLYDQQVSVLYGRCAHRGALMSDRHVDGHKKFVVFIAGITGLIPESANTTILKYYISSLRALKMAKSLSGRLPTPKVLTEMPIKVCIKIIRAPKTSPTLVLFKS